MTAARLRSHEKSCAIRLRFGGGKREAAAGEKRRLCYDFSSAEMRLRGTRGSSIRLSNGVRIPRLIREACQQTIEPLGERGQIRLVEDRRVPAWHRVDLDALGK